MSWFFVGIWRDWFYLTWYCKTEYMRIGCVSAKNVILIHNCFSYPLFLSPFQSLLHSYTRYRRPSSFSIAISSAGVVLWFDSRLNLHLWNPSEQWYIQCQPLRKLIIDSSRRCTQNKGVGIIKVWMCFVVGSYVLLESLYWCLGNIATLTGKETQKRERKNRKKRRFPHNLKQIYIKSFSFDSNNKYLPFRCDGRTTWRICFGVVICDNRKCFYKFCPAQKF